MFVRFVIFAVVLVSAPPVEAQAQLVNTSRGGPWSFLVGAQRGFESDTQVAGSGGNGDWYNRLDASLGRSWTFPRVTATLGGSVSQALYAQATNLNVFMYNVGGAAIRPLTHRLTWRASAAANRLHAEDSRLLTSAGLIFPRIVTNTNVASTDFGYLLTRRMNLETSLALTRVSFENTPLVAGTAVTARVHLSRQITRSQSIGVSGGHTISNITGDIQGLLATWQSNFGRAVVLNASAGVRPYKLDTSSGYHFAPGGSFGFSSTVAEGQTVGASYERAVEQALGAGGTHLAHRFNGNYIRALGPRLTLEGGGSYGLNTFPELENFTSDGTTVMLGMRYLLGNRLSLGAGYGVWLRRATGLPSTTTHRATVALNYGVAFGATGGRSLEPANIEPPTRQAPQPPQ